MTRSALTQLSLTWLLKYTRAQRIIWITSWQPRTERKIFWWIKFTWRENGAQNRRAFAQSIENFCRVLCWWHRWITHFGFPTSLRVPEFSLLSLRLNGYFVNSRLHWCGNYEYWGRVTDIVQNLDKFRKFFLASLWCGEMWKHFNQYWESRTISVWTEKLSCCCPARFLMPFFPTSCLTHASCRVISPHHGTIARERLDVACWTRQLGMQMYVIVAIWKANESVKC